MLNERATTTTANSESNGKKIGEFINFDFLSMSLSVSKCTSKQQPKTFEELKKKKTKIVQLHTQKSKDNVNETEECLKTKR